MTNKLPAGQGGPGRPPVVSGPLDPRGIRTRHALTSSPQSVRSVAAAAGLSIGEASRMLDNLAASGRARKVPAPGLRGTSEGWVAS